MFYTTWGFGLIFRSSPRHKNNIFLETLTNDSLFHQVKKCTKSICRILNICAVGTTTYLVYLGILAGKFNSLKLIHFVVILLSRYQASRCLTKLLNYLLTR